MRLSSQKTVSVNNDCCLSEAKAKIAQYSVFGLDVWVYKAPDFDTREQVFFLLLPTVGVAFFSA